MNKKYIVRILIIIVAVLIVKLIYSSIAPVEGDDGIVATILLSRTKGISELEIFLIGAIVFILFFLFNVQEKNLLSSDRLILRTFVAADADPILSYRSLPEVAKYQYWNPFTAEQTQDFLTKNSDTTLETKDEWIGLAIINKQNNMLIGDAAIKIFKEGAELGINISPKYQKQGFGKEALTILSKFAFEEHSSPQVFAITDADNQASVALLTSLGFIKDDSFERKVLCKGAECTEHKYIKNNPSSINA